MIGVIVYQCNSCDYCSITTKYVCPKCRKGKLEEQEVSSQGTVFSFTDVQVAPAEFADIAPYTIALVQLDASAVKVTVRMNEPVRIGDKVTLDKMENGAFLYNRI